MAKLENVPEAEKDWHPRSNGQVLDLVHPSLYPVVYDRTLAYPKYSEVRNPDDLKPCGRPLFGDTSPNAYYNSKHFQWLPTDFIVSNDSKSVESDGYINNLHPDEHSELHKTIEELIAAYIPLFERTLTDSIPENNVVPERTNNTYSYDDGGYPGKDYCRDYEEWYNNRPIILPQVVKGGYVPGILEQRKIQYTLAGRTIQVIVKLANIHLVSPNDPHLGELTS